jgi:hypothetical protein
MPVILKIAFSAARQASCHVCYIDTCRDLTTTKVFRTCLVHVRTKRLILCGSIFLQ